MPIQRLTTKETEADLEARIRAAVKLAFPWLPDAAIKHQIKFSFKFGRKTLEIDALKNLAEARLDILLEMKSTPLAVLELKRPGLELTDDDGAQGLSYARLLQPPAPLVVITNGSQFMLLETHTGKLWEPATKSDESFKSLLTHASSVSKADLRHAVDTLMGTAPTVWMQAVRHVSEDTISELTASWTEPARPFIKDFLLPREATIQLKQRLSDGHQLLVLEGSPLAGKSNVLRELHLATSESETIALLYLEAGIGNGVLQTIADSLARSLQWPVTTDEARNWLISISHKEDTRLVIAFDGLQVRDMQSVKQIEDLSSNAFGPYLSLIVAVDDSVSQGLLRAPNHRSDSSLGRKAKVTIVDQLSDQEFDEVSTILSSRGIYPMVGAAMAPEYRKPWVLRSIVGSANAFLEAMTDNQALTFPSLLGLRLMQVARERFKGEPELRGRFRGLAHAMIKESQDLTQPPDVAFQLLERCVIRRDFAKSTLESDDLSWLKEHGFIRPGMHDVVGATVIIRLPELLASEMAHVLAEELQIRSKHNLRAAAAWLSGVASSVPLGEIVAAQAFLDASTRLGSVLGGLISELVSMPPKQRNLEIGTRLAFTMPNGVVINLEVEKDGKGVVVFDGQKHEIDFVDDLDTYESISPWMILSHVASCPFEMLVEDVYVRGDARLLLQIGTCPVPLRANRGAASQRRLLTNDFPNKMKVIDHSEGIVEPITLGILSYITKEEAQADMWVKEAAESGSIPLLTRLQTALLVLSRLSKHSRSSWAAIQLRTLVLPRLTNAIRDNLAKP